MLEISIKAEPIFHLFEFPITNAYLTSIIVIILFSLVAWHFYKQSRLLVNKRSMLYFLVKYINQSLYNFFKSIVGEKINLFFPLLASLFIYIIIQNWFGLIPGVGSILIKVYEHGKALEVPLLRGGTADLNMTLALGITAIVLVQYYGIKVLGFKEYIGKFINLKSPIDLFVGLLEAVSEFSRIISFSFRLFGNIFAGEVLLAVIAFLIPVLASFPFLIMEIFVGFIQALVFAMLTTVFINSAISKHH